MAEHRLRAALAESACQQLGEFGAGNRYHLLAIEASFFARFGVPVSQLLELTETAGRSDTALLELPNSWLLGVPGMHVHPVLSTAEIACEQN